MLWWGTSEEPLSTSSSKGGPNVARGKIIEPRRSGLRLVGLKFPVSAGTVEDEPVPIRTRRGTIPRAMPPDGRQDLLWNWNTPSQSGGGGDSR